MPLDANIILNGAKLRMDQEAQNQRFSETIMDRLFQQQQLQQQGQQFNEKLGFERTKEGFNVENIFNQALLKKAQGLPLTPQEEAGLKVGDALRTSQVSQNPLTGDLYQKNRSMLDVLSEAQAPQFAPQAAPQAAAPMFEQSPASALAVNPRAQQRIIEGEIDLDLEQRKAMATERAKQTAANETAASKTAASGETIGGLLDRMDAITDKLAKMKAIPTTDGGIADNLKARARGTDVGRNTESVADPKIDALRAEYESLRNSAFPLYATALNLPATAIDTEEGRKAILKTFGDPNGNADANKAATRNLRKQFKIGDKQAAPQAAPQQANDGAMAAKLQRLQELRALKARRQGAN